MVPQPAAGGAKVKIGICGVGGMGMGHHGNISKGDVPSAEIVAGALARLPPLAVPER